MYVKHLCISLIIGKNNVTSQNFRFFKRADSNLEINSGNRTRNNDQFNNILVSFEVKVTRDLPKYAELKCKLDIHLYI